MTTQPPRPALGHLQHGLTLIEMMIALVLGLIVVAAATAVYLSNRQTYTTTGALTEVQSNARLAYELLARDIRQAGTTGCGDHNRVANVLTIGPNGGGTSVWFAHFAKNALRGFDGGTNDPALTSGTATGQRLTAASSVQLIGAGAPTVTIAAAGAAAGSLLINEASSTLKTGDLVIICNPDHATIAQLSSYTTGTKPALRFTATGDNCTAGLGFPTSCTVANTYQFPVNSQISRLSAHDWYVGHNPRGGTSLYRMALVNNAGSPGTTAQEMVRGVTDMHISYHLSTRTDYVSAADVGANWALVTAVHIDLTLQGRAKRAGVNQQPITRHVTGTVALRDPV